MDKTIFTNFIKNINPNIPNSDIEKLITELNGEKDSEIPYALRPFLEDHKCAIGTDWKWDFEDILYGIKDCVPGFEYEIIKDDYDGVADKVIVEAKINGQIVEFKGNMEDLDVLIEKINPIVSKLVDAQFEGYTTGSDSYFYLLVPNWVKLTTSEIELVESMY